MVEEKIKEHLMMSYPTKIPIIEKIKRSLSNMTILACLILFIINIASYYGIYLNFSALSPIAALITTSFLTLILLILRESYNSMNKRSEMLLAFSNELQRNWINSVGNLNKLIDELNLINNNKITLDPIVKIQLDTYGLLAQSFHKELMTMNLVDIENYVSISNKINELIINRKNISQHRHMKYLDYQNSLKICDASIIENTKLILDIIIKLLGANGNITKLDINEMKNLIDSKDLSKFSKSNQIKETLLRELVKYCNEQDVSLTLFEFNG